MNNIRTLAFMVIGAVVLSITYAVTANNADTDRIADTEGGQSVRHTINGDRGEFVLRDGAHRIKANWRGDFTLDDLGTAPANLDDELEIEIKEEGIKKRIEFESEGEEIRVVLYVDDEEQPENEETKNAIAELFLKFLQASGEKAVERVAALLNKNGVSGVLDEIDALQTSHAKTEYAIALVKEADLNADEINALAGKLQSLDSDHNLREALEALLEHEALSSATAPALIETAKQIENDHDLRQLVEAFTEADLNGEELSLVLDLYGAMESDHDLRVAAIAILDNEELNNEQISKLLAAARAQIESDHDLMLVLSETGDYLHSDESFAEAWLAAYDELDSSHEQRRALEAIADAVQSSAALKDAYKKAAADIDSEHDRQRALEAIGEND